MKRISHGGHPARASLDANYLNVHKVHSQMRIRLPYLTCFRKKARSSTNAPQKQGFKIAMSVVTYSPSERKKLGTQTVASLVTPNINVLAQGDVLHSSMQLSMRRLPIFLTYIFVVDIDSAHSKDGIQAVLSDNHVVAHRGQLVGGCYPFRLGRLVGAGVKRSESRTPGNH